MTQLAAPKMPPKATRPVAETISQAQTWDKNSNRYRAAGFCDTCAAQAAWGHQLGFTNANPPCPSCTGLTTPDGVGARAVRWAGELGPDTCATVHPDRPRADPTIVCPGCDYAWTAPGAAHCTACHAAPFASATLFDAHRSAVGEHGSCRDPEQILNRAGERVMFLRDGAWRGPEMTDEQKLARFGERSTA